VDRWCLNGFDFDLQADGLGLGDAVKKLIKPLTN
jgi:hypothetical protein